jgi:hypothetical protein
MKKSQNMLVWALFGSAKWFRPSKSAQLAEAGKRQQSCVPAIEEY